MCDIEKETNRILKNLEALEPIIAKLKFLGDCKVLSHDIILGPNLMSKDFFQPEEFIHENFTLRVIRNCRETYRLEIASSQNHWLEDETVLKEGDVFSDQRTIKVNDDLKKCVKFGIFFFQGAIYFRYSIEDLKEKNQGENEKGE